MPTLAEGSPAPDFALPTDNGTTFRLSDHRGSPIVIFFYADDDTEGCTVQNLEFSALLPEFAKLGATVIGISPNSVADHCKFRDKYALTVPLAADTELTALRAFDSWRLKKLYGREYEGVIRTSFIIAPDGAVAKILYATRIKKHAERVLAELTALAAKWQVSR